MEELQFKDIEIIFNRENPQKLGVPIRISAKVNNKCEMLEYKFIVGKNGIWNTIQDFSDNSECTWSPNSEGDYIVMVQARDKLGKKPLDYFAKEDYSIADDSNEKKTTDDLTKDLTNSVNNEENFKIAVNNVDDKITLLGAGELTNDERMLLNGIDESLIEETQIQHKDISSAKDEVALDKSDEIKTINNRRIDISYEDEKIPNHNCKLMINDIVIDKSEIAVGDKCSMKVSIVEDFQLLYRFYVKRNNEWELIRDYTTENTLKYTANESGEKEFLIQCKKSDSSEMFDDFKIVKILVKDLDKVEITNFKNLTQNLIVGEELKFEVETNKESDNSVLYKFYKIYKDGKSVCIQDYSTKNYVSYIENQKGSYRILCCAKALLSNAEYDDRAVLVYNVKPYKKIEINSFNTDLISPQADNTEIKLKSDVKGGKNLLYRYIIKGTIESDSGFISQDEYTWNPSEAGEYELTLLVKDESFEGDYEDSKKIDFTIEKRSNKVVKITEVIVDKEKNLVVDEPINIMVAAEGGTRLSYGFKINKDNKEISSVSYNKSNWVNFTPKEAGDYEVEILIKDKYCRRDYDTHTFVHLKVLEYIPGEIDYVIMPYKDNYLVGDTIEFECITQNTKNVLIKYETKINGHAVEKTDFLKQRTLKVSPKIPGKYTINVYAKNIKCKEEYDSKKEVNIRVIEAAPVMNTKIKASAISGNINEEISFEVSSTGGKEVCYEFYLMENEEWKKVQPYSRKNYYSFMPFVPGKYRILAFAKSYYKKVSYEDYDEFDFEIKANKN